MKLKNSILAGCTALVVATSCTQRAVEKQTWVEKAIENAHAQIGLEIDTIESSGRFLNPVTLNNKGGVYYCGYADWRSGFFPGSVWYLYELTGDTALLPPRNIPRLLAKHKILLGITILVLSLIAALAMACA